MQLTKPAILCTGPVEESLLLSPEYGDADIDVIPFTTISTELPESGSPPPCRQRIPA